MKTQTTQKTIYAIVSFLWIFVLFSCSKGGNDGKPQAPSRNERPDGGFYIPVDPITVITVDNAIFPINRLIVGFQDNVSRQQVDEVASAVNAQIVGYFPSSNNYQFEIQNSTDAELEGVINQLETNPIVDYAFKNYQKEKLLESDIILLDSTSKLAYSNIMLQEAWDLLENDLLNGNLSLKPVYVAIVDSGVNKDNREFVGVNFGDSEDQQTLNPFDFPYDDSSEHGTGVAGILGSVVNALGANGILAFELGGFPLIIDYTLQVHGSIYVGDVLNAFEEATSDGAKIINISLGLNIFTVSGSSISEKLNTLNEIKQAYSEAFAKHDDVLFVICAGNDGMDLDGIGQVPAGIILPNVITVGGLDASTNTRANDSNFASINPDKIQISAPYDVYTIAPDNTFAIRSGTSFSAPLVTGTAGLIHSIDPNLTAGDLKNILISSGNITDSDIGGKRLNAYNTVLAVTGGSINSPTNLSASLYYSNVVKLTWIDNSLNEDGFIVERKESTASTFIQIANISMKDIVTFYDLSATPLKNYDYRIYAYKASGNSGFSNVISISTPGGIMYQEDFTVDPLWTTNYPTRIYWDSLQGNFYSNFYYRNDQSWQYGFSDYIVSTKDLLIEWDSLFTGDLYGATFGFVYSDGQNPPGYIGGVYYSNVGVICGTGNSLCIYLRFGNRSYSACQCSAIESLAYGRWVHNKLKYDNINQNFLYVATLLSSGQQIRTISTEPEAICDSWSWSLTAPTCPYLGFGVNGSQTQTSLLQSYLRVDNINLYYPSTFK